MATLNRGGFFASVTSVLVIHTVPSSFLTLGFITIMPNYIKEKQVGQRYAQGRSLITWVYRHAPSNKQVVVYEPLNNDALQRMGVTLIAAIAQ